MITSATNAKVKQVGRLQTDRRFRQREGVFIAEGTRWMRDFRVANHAPVTVFHTPDYLESLDNEEVALLDGWETAAVTPAIMRKMSDVETPPGVLAIAPIPQLPTPDSPTRLLILDHIQTPGNMGTMLRTASAAGVSAVILAPGCVDPYNPKVVRGSMGAHLRLPIVSMSWDEIGAYTAQMNVYVAALQNSVSYMDVDWRGRSAIIIGNEANGAGESALTLGTPIIIPMANATESLNAAMAAGIILFEAIRPTP